MAGVKAVVKNDQSTKEKTIYHRNTNTDGVVYGARWCYGVGRGDFTFCTLYTFRTTTLFRKAIKIKIDQELFTDWYVFDHLSDYKRVGVPDNYKEKRDAKNKKRINKQTQNLD
jgi:hypothetical protein